MTSPPLKCKQAAAYFATDENRQAMPAQVATTADLFLAVPAPGSPGLWLEMKVPGNGQQESQKEFQAAVEAAGYQYAVPKSLDAFQAAINNYLKTGKPS